MKAGRGLLPLVALGAAAAVVGVVLTVTSSRGKAIDVPSTHAASWGKAIEVPGTAALNSGGFAGVDSLSCTSAGNCTAGGGYRFGSTDRAFVANEKDGVWGTAISTEERNTLWHAVIDGLETSHLSRAHLSQGFATVETVECTKPGSCVAGGSYYDGRSGCGIEDGYCYQAYVVTKTKGVWGKPIEVPGTAKLNSDGDGSLDTISCWSTGNCTAVGTFMSGLAALSDEAFFVEERNGVWGKAIRFPFPTAMLDADGGYGITDLFCDSAGSCAATGGAPSVSVFVVNKTHGTWGKPIPVPGLEPLEEGGSDAVMRALSCTTARFCTAGGSYTVGMNPDDSSTGHVEPFLVTETNGVWGTAFTPPGFDDLNEGEFSDLFSISCATATSCAAGGMYTDDSHRQQGFVVSETNGVWGEAIEVPGSAALSVGHNENGSDAEVDQVVCATADSCTAGGFYTDRAGHQQAFVTAP